MGGKFHLKLNIGERPIANKYREGKMKRTLKRELKVLEIVKREALETSDARGKSVFCTGELWAFRRASLAFASSLGVSDALFDCAGQHQFDLLEKARERR